MFSNALSLLYIVMCFLGLQGLALAVFLIKHNRGGNQALLKATRNFILVSFLLGAFYFFTYYRELVLGEFEANAFMRAVDSIQFYAMGLTWLKLVDAIIASKNPRMDRLRKITTPVFVLLMSGSAFIYVFLLDGYYSTEVYAAELCAITGEFILGFALMFFTIAYVSAGFSELADGAGRRYIIWVTGLINFNTLWNNTIVVAVFINAVHLDLICSKLYGVTAIALLLINLWSVVYLYKKDFSPLYLKAKGEGGEKISAKNALDLVAEAHRLTEREREVMLLAYSGKTNPSIAEDLSISKYTVKRHMHNLFEKLDVSTRMEMIHLINAQTEQGKNKK